MDKEKLERLFKLNFRDWQARKAIDFLDLQAKKKPYKKGVIAPLGAGKTLLGLVCSCFVEKTIIFCPTFLIQEWQQEAKKFGIMLPDISTYESSKKVIGKYDLVIMDEVLKVKNPDSLRTSDIRKLTYNTKNVLGLTGTPKSAKECLDLRWVNSIFCIRKNENVFYPLPEDENIFKKTFSKWQLAAHPFKTKEGIVKQKKHIEVIEWKQEKINKHLSDLFYQCFNEKGSFIETVDKAELLKDVPECIKKTVIVEMPRQYYSLINGCFAKNKSKAISQARTITDGFIYDDLGLVKLAQDIPKVKKLNEEIKKFREKGEDTFLIFCAWMESVEILKRNFPEAVTLCSANNKTQNDLAILQFKEGEKKILIASANYAEGMNLQKVCSVCFFYSNSLSPMKREQAEGRIYRPGQEKVTYIIDLICENTLDGRLLSLLEKHKNASEAFMKECLMNELRMQFKF